VRWGRGRSGVGDGLGCAVSKALERAVGPCHPPPSHPPPPSLLDQAPVQALTVARPQEHKPPVLPSKVLHRPQAPRRRAEQIPVAADPQHRRRHVLQHLRVAVHQAPVDGGQPLLAVDAVHELRDEAAGDVAEAVAHQLLAHLGLVVVAGGGGKGDRSSQRRGLGGRSSRLTDSIGQDEKPQPPLQGTNEKNSRQAAVAQSHLRVPRPVEQRLDRLDARPRPDQLRKHAAGKRAGEPAHAHRQQQRLERGVEAAGAVAAAAQHRHAADLFGEVALQGEGPCSKHAAHRVTCGDTLGCEEWTGDA